MRTSKAVTLALVGGVILGGAGTFLYHQHEAKNDLAQMELPTPRAFERLIDSEMPVPDIKRQDKDDQVIYTMNIRGMDKKDLRVDVSQGIVTVSGSGSNIEAQEDRQGHEVVRNESYRSFSRSFSLPSDVDESQVKSEVKGDELIIQIPKKKI